MEPTKEQRQGYLDGYAAAVTTAQSFVTRTGEPSVDVPMNAGSKMLASLLTSQYEMLLNKEVERCKPIQIQWNGRNAKEIAEAVCGCVLDEYELTPAVSLRQRDLEFFLTLPARKGEVWLSKWDWAVREEDGEWVRLSPEQFAEEYPNHGKEKVVDESLPTS